MDSKTRHPALTLTFTLASVNRDARRRIGDRRRVRCATPVRPVRHLAAGAAPPAHRPVERALAHVSSPTSRTPRTMPTVTNTTMTTRAMVKTTTGYFFDTSWSFASSSATIARTCSAVTPPPDAFASCVRQNRLIPAQKSPSSCPPTNFSLRSVTAWAM